MSEKLLRIAVKAYEKRYIRDVLKIYGWDKAKTAKALGIGLSTLYKKIIELKIKKGIPKPESET